MWQIYMVEECFQFNFPFVKCLRARKKSTRIKKQAERSSLGAHKHPLMSIKLAARVRWMHFQCVCSSREKPSINAERFFKLHIFFSLGFFYVDAIRFYPLILFWFSLETAMLQFTLLGIFFFCILQITKKNVCHFVNTTTITLPSLHSSLLHNKWKSRFHNNFFSCVIFTAVVWLYMGTMPVVV